MKKTLGAVVGKLVSLVLIVLEIYVAVKLYIEPVVVNQVGITEYYGFWNSISIILALLLFASLICSTLVNGWKNTLWSLDGDYPLGCLFWIGASMFFATFLIAILRKEIPFNCANGFLAVIATAFLTACFVSLIVAGAASIIESRKQKKRG